MFLRLVADECGDSTEQGCDRVRGHFFTKPVFKLGDGKCTGKGIPVAETGFRHGYLGDGAGHETLMGPFAHCSISLFRTTDMRTTLLTLILRGLLKGSVPPEVGREHDTSARMHQESAKRTKMCLKIEKVAYLNE